MLFSTPTFLFIFFPIFFTGYYFAEKRLKNILALTASCFFYAWGEPRFIIVILVSLFLDWFLGNQIYKYKNKVFLSKIFLTISIVYNIGILFYFKYFNVCIDNVNTLFRKFGVTNIAWIKIALPIGISFIVFEKITYLVDIYKSVGKPAKTLSSYAMYILLFPKLLAGPIVKYHDIENQLMERKYSLHDISYGLYRFSIGLAKKVLIADTLSVITDEVFKIPLNSLSVSYAWIGIICFTIQIYFDFSGYSDMAIGMARMMGFKLNENFKTPYLAQSFTDFWRRWHISLSTWIKNYLYIPLGGNRCSKNRQYFNLWLCFLISGLWHGASWTFIVWGVYHGLFLVIDKVFWLEKSKNIPKFINTFLTFIFIMIGWVFFRATTITQAIGYIVRMFDISSINHVFLNHIVFIKNSVIFTIIISLTIIFIPVVKICVNEERDISFKNMKIPKQLLVTFMLVLLVLLSLLKISAANFSPFIYFRF